MTNVHMYIYIYIIYIYIYIYIYSIEREISVYKKIKKTSGLISTCHIFWRFHNESSKFEHYLIHISEGCFVRTTLVWSVSVPYNC